MPGADDYDIQLARGTDAREIARMSRDYIEAGLGWSWLPRRVLGMIRHPECVVLIARSVNGGPLAGFAIMEYHQKHAHLNLLAVNPDHRRTGLGRRLLEWLEETARVAGTFRIVLEVRARNFGARGFYRELGYYEREYIPGYYQGQESALRMMKRLEQEVASP
jgi:ribosomal protein S18 acetylase RimI-like enzyme